MPRPEPNDHRRLIQAATWTAPLLLTALACTQLVFANASRLSPWKGGGFGMFSTLDSPSARSLRFYVETPEGDRIAEAPRWLDRRNRSLRTFPSDWVLGMNARRLAETRWMKDGDEFAELLRTEELPPGEEWVEVEAVRIEVWRKRFNREDQTLHLEKFAVARAPVDP